MTDGSLRVILAFARTWDDAPCDIALLVRALTPGGDARAAVVRKHVSSLQPETIGLTVPMAEAGVHVLEVSLARVEADGSFTPLFTLPEVAVTVVSPAAAHVEAAAVALEEEEEMSEDGDVVVVARVVREEVSREVVALKVAMDHDTVIRRISVPVPLDIDGVPVGGYGLVEAALCKAFANELRLNTAVQLRYKDCEGDSVRMSCDEELGEAMAQRAPPGGVIRLGITQ